MWHPTSLLLAWAGFVAAQQWMSIVGILILVPLCLGFAAFLAGNRLHVLLMRCRWILLTVFLLFVFLTPGEYLPGLPGESGVTYEGLRTGTEQAGRLLITLASLALLHECLGSRGLLVGCYCVLWSGAWREMTVVRLILILEAIEQRQVVSWREWLNASELQSGQQGESFALRIPSFCWNDWMLIGSMVFVVMAVIVMS